MKITEISGVGAKRAHALQLAGITTVSDLLNYFPRDYDDRSNVKTIKELSIDAVNTIRGKVFKEPENGMITRKNSAKLTVTKVIIKDHTGTLEIIWFNQPYLKKYFKKNNEYIFTGKVKVIFGERIQMQSPDYEPCGDVELSGGRIVPVYTTPKQFSQKTFRSLIYQVLEINNDTHEAYNEVLPHTLRQKYNLTGRKSAVKNIHFPESNEKFLASRRRLVFEELFFIQKLLFDLKGAVSAQAGLTINNSNFTAFTKTLSFALTNAQLQVLTDIATDMTSGKRMNRLIQGDVGSGKTAVALAAAFMAINNGYQTALMAPTDVLANQHFEECNKLLKPLGIEIALLTGSLRAKPRREFLEKIENGQASMIVGTHALFQKGVTYNNLGLVITDEQHRFGVDQRLNLTKKGQHPHTLVMTATPIPRTLGMILYGDLDISIINEMPPGRQEIKTYCVNSAYKERLHEFIKKEVSQNQQVYIICPAIEESESENKKNELKNVLAYTSMLKNHLPDISIDYLHGKMKASEKQQSMDNFKLGITKVIVSTTVIEVGIHVPNATLIIIENAERFGLSQLHQLRGRVGRGKNQSYCVLITDTKNDETKARMKAMTDTTDGFKLAEIDLEQRGAGDFFGTRQHGLPSFSIANLYRDIDILEEVQNAVTETFEKTEKEEEILNKRIAQVLSTTKGGVM